MMNYKYNSRIIHPSQLSYNDINIWNTIQRENIFLQTPFLSYHYINSVASAKEDVWVCIIELDGKPVIFFPFQYRSLFHKTIKVAERVGDEMTDYFGIIASPDVSIKASELICLSHLNYIGFTHLDASQRTFYGLKGEKPEPGLRISIEECYFENLRKTKNKILSDTCRRERKIESDLGPLSFCFNVQDRSKRAKALEHLIKTKKAQYHRTNSNDSLKQNWKMEMLKSLSFLKDNECEAILSVLFAGDVWVASHFGLRFGNTLHYWFPVYNPSLKKYSPGRLLLKFIISNTQEKGIQIIDRGAGITPSKMEFANQEHVYFRGAWFKPCLISILYRIYLSIKWRTIKFVKK